MNCLFTEKEKGIMIDALICYGQSEFVNYLENKNLVKDIETILNKLNFFNI